MLYLHIPYCHHKCTYCAFYSRAAHGVDDSYVTALCRELNLRRHDLDSHVTPNNIDNGRQDKETKHPLQTIYFGGGTPSLLSLTQLNKIKDCIANNFDLTNLQEVTLECNPENLTADYLRGLKEMNFFNRLSIGIQSFNDADLRLLNRIHTGNQAYISVQEAYRQGFRNISVDLIYGLPGQSVDEWQHNLDEVQKLPLSHLSCYSLTVEPSSMLQKQIEKGLLSPADEATTLQQYGILLDRAEKNGFEQYEISNFCKRDMNSRHNSRYWTRVPYLGCGAAAHSFDGLHRRWNVADTQQYIQGVNNDADGTHPVRYYSTETLSPADIYNETIMLGLRTLAGIKKDAIAVPLQQRLNNDIQGFIHAGLIQETATHYRPTREGLLHADGISGDLFIDKA